MRGDVIETFKIINGIYNYGRHFFSTFPWIRNLLSKQISKIDSFANSDIFFGTNFLIRSKTAIVSKVLRLNCLITERMVRI